VDYVAYLGEEVAAFEAAGREAVTSDVAPGVPSCPRLPCTGGTPRTRCARPSRSTLPSPPTPSCFETDRVLLGAPSGSHDIDIFGQRL